MCCLIEGALGYYNPSPHSGVSRACKFTWICYSENAPTMASHFYVGELILSANRILLEDFRQGLPVQTNAHDCGLRVLLWVLVILRGFRLNGSDFQEMDMPAW